LYYLYEYFDALNRCIQLYSKKQTENNRLWRIVFNVKNFFCNTKGDMMRNLKRVTSFTLGLMLLPMFTPVEESTNTLLSEVNSKLIEVTYAHEQVRKKQPVKYIKKFEGNISAYTNSRVRKTSRHADYGRTASGRIAMPNRTIAAGKHIPFGTVVYIEGMGYFTVEDRGGAIKGNKIDVFMSNMREAKKFGRQHRTVYIIKWGNGKRVRH
jgi:3D (Asp-Asp-Asp) domain-containing protein